MYTTSSDSSLKMKREEKSSQLPLVPGKERHQQNGSLTALRN